MSLTCTASRLNSYFNYRIDRFCALALTAVVTACGGGGDGSGSGSTPSNAPVIKLGDITYSAVGSGSFYDPYIDEKNNGSCSGTRSIRNLGAGTLTFHDQVVVKMKSEGRKIFGASNSKCPENEVTDAQPLTCVRYAKSATEEVIEPQNQGWIQCSSYHNLNGYIFKIDAKKGYGTVEYFHHYTEGGKQHYGKSYGTVTPSNWLGF
jgi:hypothetical protein